MVVVVVVLKENNFFLFFFSKNECWREKVEEERRDLGDKNERKIDINRKMLYLFLVQFVNGIEKGKKREFIHV